MNLDRILGQEGTLFSAGRTRRWGFVGTVVAAIVTALAVAGLLYLILRK